MARPKEFDEGEVLDKALELFRAQGFQATSFSDLTAKLGVSRQSLYDTYGDKEELFLAALRRYMDLTTQCVGAVLQEALPVRAVLLNLFEKLISNQCDNGSHGCLLANTMVEMAPNPAVCALVSEHVRVVEELFIARLTAARSNQEIAADKDPIALARFLYHCILGVAVAARAQSEKDALRQTAHLSLRVLD